MYLCPANGQTTKFKSTLNVGYCYQSDIHIIGETNNNNGFWIFETMINNIFYVFYHDSCVKNLKSSLNMK